MAFLEDSRLPTPIAIIGMGITGSSAHKLLLQAGYQTQDLLTFDQKAKDADFQNPDLLMSREPKTLVVSPGVPMSLPWIQAALAKGMHLTSELEIATHFLTDEKIIAITGSVGKSTVTEMLGAAFRANDRNTFVGGNLGEPLANYALQVLSGARPAKFVILEISSYQLECYKNLCADAGIITFLSPNHLDRYRNLDHYYATKLSLLDRCRGPVFLNKNGGDLWDRAEKIVSQKTRWVDRESPLLVKIEPARILGSHNRDNLAIAAEVMQHFQLPQISFEALKNFPGLDHRIENIGTHAGITFINDSKATTMDSVLVAVQCVLESSFFQKNCVLLLGGRDKNLPWEALQSLPSSVSVVYFGEFAQNVKTRLGRGGPCYPSLKSCLASIREFASAGDVVLLSPGGSSLDEFSGFAERGNYFKAWLKNEFQNAQ